MRSAWSFVKRPSRRGRDERRLPRVGLVAGDEVGGAECDCLMFADELFISGGVAPLRAGDELRFGKSPAHHRG